MAERRGRTKEDAEGKNASKTSLAKKKVVKKVSDGEKKKDDCQNLRKVDTGESDEFDSDSSSSDEEGTWQKAGKKGRSPRQTKERYICKGGDDTCNKVIKRKEASIECEACENWYHAECQGLSQSAWGAIKEHNLFWVCGNCQKQFVEMQNIRKQVKADIELVETHVVKKVEEVKSLVEKVIDKKVDDGLKKMEVKFGESSTALKKVVQEKNIDRSRNLIIHNIPECDSDDPKVRAEHDVKEMSKITQSLCGTGTSTNIARAFRLNRQKPADLNEVDRRPRLLLIKLDKEEDAESLFMKRFGLRDAGFPNIYITRDLSKEERERQWKLREELKRKGKDAHKIFRGKVVPRGQ